VFTVGADSGLYHKCWNGSAWSDFEALGGICMSKPRAVAWGPNRLDVFVIGTDGGLYHKYWNGSAWGPSATGYEALGAVISQLRELEDRDHDELERQLALEHWVA
jgi:hypothetical protein